MSAASQELDVNMARRCRLMATSRHNKSRDNEAGGEGTASDASGGVEELVVFAPFKEPTFPEVAAGGARSKLIVRHISQPCVSVIMSSVRSRAAESRLSCSTVSEISQREDDTDKSTPSTLSHSSSGGTPVRSLSCVKKSLFSNLCSVSSPALLSSSNAFPAPK